MGPDWAHNTTITILSILRNSRSPPLGPYSLEKGDLSRRMRLEGLRPAHVAAAASGLAALLPPSAARAVDAIAAVATDAEVASALTTFEPRGITAEDSVIFVLGCVPFVYAGIEFWTRIANGLSFGTGKDSVFIEPLGKQYDGNKRILGADAIIAARILFAIAGVSLVSVVVTAFDLLK